MYPVQTLCYRSSEARAFFLDRKAQLDAIQAELDRLPGTQRIQAWLDDRLGFADLKDGAGNIVLHALGLGSIDSLQTDFENDRLGIQPQQFGLIRRELNALLTIRKLIIGALADDQDWKHIFQILIQAEKRRYFYPIWRAEEASKRFTLSPEFFGDRTPPAIEDTRLPEIIEWRGDPASLSAWTTHLRARYEQRTSLTGSLRSVVDQAEEAALPALRDALIDVVYEDSGGINREQNKKTLTNALLINASENACRKTTRVAQAMETIQLLVWGILNGQIEDNKWKIPDQGQEEFKANWHWLNSYATWRAAMFVFLYPENYLYPRLLPEQEKTILHQVFDIIQKYWTSLGKMGAGESVAGGAEVVGFANTVAYNLRGRGLTDGDYLSDRWLRELFFELSVLRYIVTDNERQMARLEYLFYIPVSIALELKSRGDFERSLRSFKKVFDFDQHALVSDVQDLLSVINTSNGFQYNGESWLNDELNPHLLATTRPVANLRFIEVSIIRCLLDYAEAEFTTDTSESLAHARELYYTAQRLLDSPELKQNLPDCGGSIGKLIIEIGEIYHDRPDIRNVITDAVARGGLQIHSRQIPVVIKAIEEVLTRSATETSGNTARRT